MDKLVRNALAVIRLTRDMSFPNWGNVEVAGTKSSASDIVTEIDRSIECYLAENLARIDPSAGFVGEEFGGDRNQQRFWLVDPIDGTTEFVRGLRSCTSMIALIDDDQVIFSAIYDFVDDVMYHAVRGGGAFQNGTRIQVSERQPKSSNLCLESKLSDERTMKAFLKLRALANTCIAGVAGYELAMVACGKMEGRINLDPYGKDYDYAAGTLLVREAGGVVRNIGSDSYDYRNLNFVAANKPLHAAIVAQELKLFF